MTEEVPLAGGALTAGVVRVGDTVRRPTGPHSAAAHDALRRLEAAGFEHAPRFLGIDDRGREILTYAPGVTMWPGAPELLGRDDTLERAGRIVRALHDALPGLLHGDLGAWNVVVDGDRWTIIDWDEVETGETPWELALCLLSFCDLWKQSSPAPVEAARRIRLFGDAYGLAGDELVGAVRLVPRRCLSHAAAIERHAADGHEAYGALLAEGHGDMWRRQGDHCAAQLPAWLDALVS